MLLITDEEVQQVASMDECIEAMERAFAEEAKGVAVNRPRVRYRVPLEDTQVGYMANMIAGAVPSSGVAALRYDSTMVRERVIDGSRRMEFPYPMKRSWGFVMLFRLATGEPLALIHDFSLSALRVGATTGVASRALSRTDSRVVGLFGSGNEARRNLEGICRVRKVDRVTIYSPSQEHREEFAAEMSQRLEVEIEAVDDSRPVVQGAQIIMCATNSSQPVFDGEWLQPGQFVITIANTDGIHRRSEADALTFTRSDLIVLSNKETAIQNQQKELLDLIDEEKLGWEKVCELGEILIGKHAGRVNDEQLIYYKNNTGLGIQFAAAGEVIYEACKKGGLGRELPTEWFGADVSEWLDRGFSPSP